MSRIRLVLEIVLLEHLSRVLPIMFNQISVTIARLDELLAGADRLMNECREEGLLLPRAFFGHYRYIERERLIMFFRLLSALRGRDTVAAALVQAREELRRLPK